MVIIIIFFLKNIRKYFFKFNRSKIVSFYTFSLDYLKKVLFIVTILSFFREFINGCFAIISQK